MNGSFHFCRNEAAVAITSCHICGIEDSIKKFASYDLDYRTMTICLHCLKKLYSLDVIGKDTHEGMESIATIIKNSKYENCILPNCKYCGL